MLELELSPKLYPLQYEAFFCKERYSFTEASTKSGKTVGCLQWLTKRGCELGGGRQHWWTAPVYSQAEIGFFRLSKGFRQFREQGFIPRKKDLALDFPNGAILKFRSAEEPDNLYGDDVFSGVMDEASRCREESFYALRSTLTKTQGLLRLIGNVKGRKNFFYELCRRAEQGAENMKYTKITAYDAVKAGVFPMSELEDAKSILPEHIFRELYLAEPSDDGGNPFGLDSIRACIKPELSKKPAVVFGIDFAKSINDNSVIGLDEDGNVCVFEYWTKTTWLETYQRIARIVKRHTTLSCAPAVYVDNTGVGDPVEEELQRYLPNNKVFGFRFSATSKQKLMERLAISIQSCGIGFPKGLISQQLLNFEYVNTRTYVLYSAPIGMKDDHVCSLALANWGRHSIASNAYTPVSGIVEVEDVADYLGEYAFLHRLFRGIESDKAWN